MNCELAEQLLAAHALGVLEETETGALRRHLLECADCRREGAALEQVAGRLALSVEEVTPSRALRSRLLADVHAEATGGAVSRPGPHAPWWQRAWARVPTARSLTAAGALATAGALSAALVLAFHHGPAPAPAPQALRVAACGLVSQPRTCGTLTYDPSTRQAVLSVSGLAPVPTLGGTPTGTYEVWLVRSDSSASAAAFLVPSPDGHTYVAAMQGDMRGVSAVVTTSEPYGGSRHPTGAEVLRLPLPSQASAS